MCGRGEGSGFRHSDKIQGMSYGGTDPSPRGTMVGINSGWFFREVAVGGKQLLHGPLIPVACFLIASLLKSYVLLTRIKKASQVPLKGWGQAKTRLRLRGEVHSDQKGPAFPLVLHFGSPAALFSLRAEQDKCPWILQLQKYSSQSSICPSKCILVVD